MCVGTQCGYCTPGWVTNMYALNQANDQHDTSSTKKQIDAYFDGNICRCTGYRPIIEAFQSFSSNELKTSTSTTTRADKHHHHPLNCVCSCCMKSRALTGCNSSVNSDSNPCEVLQCSGEKQKQCHDAQLQSSPIIIDMEDTCCRSTGSAAATTISSRCDHSNGNDTSIHTVRDDAQSQVCLSKGGHSSIKAKAQQQRQHDIAMVKAYQPQPLYFHDLTNTHRWFRPINLEQLCSVLNHVASTPDDASRVQLVGGNTSIGVSKYLNSSGPYFSADKYSIFIDINCISIMTAINYDSTKKELTIGAVTSIHSVIKVLEQYSPSLQSLSTHENNNLQISESATGKFVNHHSVFSVTANHLSKIANTQVRNAGSWAGNLMLFLRYPSFPSDAVMALLTANAKLQLSDHNGTIIIISMEKFISFTIDTFFANGYMIVGLIIQEGSSSSSLTSSSSSSSSRTTTSSSSSSSLSRATTTTFITETFKVSQRIRNSHAEVNAGFQFVISSSSSLSTSPSSSPSTIPTCISSRIVFGGVSSTIFIAKKTQHILSNNVPLTSSTLQLALLALQDDLNDVGKSKSLIGSQQFRESVMQTFLYRVLLRAYPILDLPSSIASVLQPWNLPVTRGVEIFDQPTDEDDISPVGQPIGKLEGPIQATGEAKYVLCRSSSSR